VKVTDYVAYTIAFDDVPKERIARLAAAARKRAHIETRPADMKRFREEVDLIVRLYNEAWAANWGFLPLTDEDADAIADVPAATQTMHYLAQYGGTDFYNPSSSSMTVGMLAYLTSPSAKRNATRTYTMTGGLGSWHAAGPAVQIYLWRYVGGKWKAAGCRTASVAGYFVLQLYSAKYKFPAAGKWRLQAYHSDASHAPTRSAYTYLTVK
jgi:hypothetical protein